MVFAFLLALSLADWVPARWWTSDPKSLSLLEGTPVNCLLLEKEQWNQEFKEKSEIRGTAVLALLHPGGDAQALARRALDSKFPAVVLEGDFPAADRDAIRDLAAKQNVPLIELTSRQALRFDRGPITGTYQGVWPGIRAEHPLDNSSHAAPTGNPWIDTNTGFLRFGKSAAQGDFWIANQPPPNTVVTAERYQQVIADASMVGARWVVALDADFQKRLSSGDTGAHKDWKRIATVLRFYEDHKEVRALRPYSQLAIVQDVDSGALLSGGVIDMLAVQNTPVIPIPGHSVTEERLTGTKLAVNIDPAGLEPAQKEALKSFTRRGGTVVNGPPGWKMPATSKNGLTLDKEHQQKVDAIWPDLHGLTNRKNLGARLFNVSSMLSYLQATPDGKRILLQLVNYSEYPVENVTAFVLGKFEKVTLYAPGEAPRKMMPYQTDEGTGVDIDKVGVSAILVLE